MFVQAIALTSNTGWAKPSDQQNRSARTGGENAQVEYTFTLTEKKLLDIKGGMKMEKEFYKGQYVIYENGDKIEIGRIKTLEENGAFVAYHEGETGAKTPYELMKPIDNDYCIKGTTLGGEYF